MKRILTLVTTLLLTASSVLAQTNVQTNVNTDSIKAANDSINKAALDPDFIHVSLVRVTGGNRVYSACGHNALRLESPSNGFDIVYTFEMNITGGNMLKFFHGTAPAGYIDAKTSLFLDTYKDEGRGAVAIRLNLNPREEQKLWKYMDEERVKGAHWRFDYMHSGCSAMTLNALYHCLDEGSRIEFRNISPYLHGTYREVLPHIFADSPWVELFWSMIMGTAGEETEPLEGRFYPQALLDESQRMIIVDSLGNERPLTVGAVYKLKDKTFHEHAVPVTPLIAFSTLLLLALLVSVLGFVRGQYGLIGRAVDTILLALQSVVGLGYVYMLFFSEQVATEWNWLFIPFNPLPLLAWLLLHKRTMLMKRAYWLMSAVLAVFLVASPWIPQMTHTHLWIILTAFLVRTVALAIAKKTETKTTK